MRFEDVVHDSFPMFCKKYINVIYTYHTSLFNKGLNYQTISKIKPYKHLEWLPKIKFKYPGYRETKPQVLIFVMFTLLCFFLW